MSEVWSTKTIGRRKKADAKEIRLQILNELRKEGRRQVRELKKTIETWKGVRPGFDFLVGLTRDGHASVLTGPVGPKFGVLKWFWLDQGTKIRWALMSRDWRSKTTRRSFSSRPGEGRAVLRGRRAMLAAGIGPRPGIEAREWTNLLMENRKRPFQRNMGKAVRRGTRKFWVNKFWR